ncbi:aminotransferase class V-fold PLP-dependent enzyme [Salinibacterium soli]|uniref:Aminotransferase class V-fold PLP-dependent enzyme n=1 Tax=Antiquaquibacter soli TaxID=3064523 RepID=A0ABT9BJS1_9MICO|nr:aminotransferase class V-fold PLP-dependent enzyme [Protaetiibacter sp. WY-16]MDO7881266.1 aminotransferase class V-fold PLP-dependent enzyme [Protaetiibacter sp. WY-16]
MTAQLSLDDYLERFTDEPGYLDFARVGPVGRTVRDEESAQSSLLGRARFGTLATLAEQDARARAAVATTLRSRDEQVVFQPNTSQGLMHALFGLDGRIAISPAEFPSLTFAAQRAHDAVGRLEPVWLEPDHGRVTPGALRERLTDDITAVGVSLVDFRTGYLLDLEGVREVVGDRFLVLDAMQGFGLVDAPWHLADVVVSGGQKWVRAGWGTGFLALSDRAAERLSPLLSGFSATDAEETPLDEVLPPTRGAAAFQISHPDPVAQARLAAALEELAMVGSAAVLERVAERVSQIIDLADEFGVEVVSPRDERERAGIVVLQPRLDRLTILTASLHNHGITATTRGGAVRLAPHATTDDETIGMLRAALISFATAA